MRPPCLLLVLLLSGAAVSPQVRTLVVNVCGGLPAGAADCLLQGPSPLAGISHVLQLPCQVPPAGAAGSYPQGPGPPLPGQRVCQLIPAGAASCFTRGPSGLPLLVVQLIVSSQQEIWDEYKVSEKKNYYYRRPVIQPCVQEDKAAKVCI